MKILYFASIRDFIGHAEDAVTLTEPTSVRDFINRHVKPELEGYDLNRFLFAVNEEVVSLDHPLTDDDTLAIMPPLSGGASFTRIQEDDFNMELETHACIGGRSDIGGVATFTGIVRNVSRGRTITKIELTCYRSMAERQIDALRSDTMQRFDVANLAIVHRTGELKPGEKIVGIVAVARHRKEAFEACRYAIDGLKARVPIWKKEFTDSGDWWVEEQ